MINILLALCAVVASCSAVVLILLYVIHFMHKDSYNKGGE